MVAPGAGVPRAWVTDAEMTDAESPSGEARERFDRLLELVVAELGCRDDVVGVVGMGSTAARDRVDEWSDHDLAVIVQDGAHDRYRDPATWLPRPERIALAVREWHDGVKVLYDDGHVVEFGVATPDELRGWHVDASAVYLDRGGVTPAVAAAVRKPPPRGRPDVERELAVLVICIMVGVGRARRGELISANAVLRGQAVDAFVTAVAAHARPRSAADEDSLDMTRRFEARHPSVARRLAELLALDLEACARGLLELAVEIFGEAVPPRGVAAVRARLGWS